MLTTAEYYRIVYRPTSGALSGVQGGRSGRYLGLLVHRSLDPLCSPLQNAFPVEMNPSWRPPRPGEPQPQVILACPALDLKRPRTTYRFHFDVHLYEAIRFPFLDTLLVGESPGRNPVDHRCVIMIDDPDQPSTVLAKDDSVHRPVSYGGSPSINNILRFRRRHYPTLCETTTDEEHHQRKHHQESIQYNTPAYTMPRENVLPAHLRLLCFCLDCISYRRCCQRLFMDTETT